MDMNNMTREDIICMMDAEIDFAIGDYPEFGLLNNVWHMRTM